MSTEAPLTEDGGRIKRMAPLTGSLEFHLRFCEVGQWMKEGRDQLPKRILIKLTKCQPLISIVGRAKVLCGQLLPFRGLISGFLDDSSSTVTRSLMKKWRRTVTAWHHHHQPAAPSKSAVLIASELCFKVCHHFSVN